MQHMRQRELAAAEHAVNIHREHAAPVLLRDILKHLLLRNAGVVDEQFHRARPRKQLLTRRAARKVRTHRERARFARKGRRLLLVAAECKGHAPAVAHEPPADRRADAAAAAGHECPFFHLVKFPLINFPSQPSRPPGPRAAPSPREESAARASRARRPRLPSARPLRPQNRLRGR